jgi:hypothetical protein
MLFYRLERTEFRCKPFSPLHDLWGRLLNLIRSVGGRVCPGDGVVLVSCRQISVFANAAGPNAENGQVLQGSQQHPEDSGVDLFQNPPGVVRIPLIEG